MLTENRKQYAIKSIKKFNLNSRQIRRLESELEILQFIDHPYIIKYHGAFMNESMIHIVTELCSGGEIFEYVNLNGPMSEYLAAKVLY